MQQDNIDLIGGTNGELNDFTNRLSKHSKGPWYGTRHREEHDHDQQHERHRADISMESQNLEAVTSLKSLRAILCKESAAILSQLWLRRPD